MIHSMPSRLPAESTSSRPTPTAVLSTLCETVATLCLVCLTAAIVILAAGALKWMLASGASPSIPSFPPTLPDPNPAPLSVGPAEAPGAAVVRPISLSPYWSGSVKGWEPLIVRWSAQYVVDVDLVASVMAMESGGNPNALSRAGAVGLLQIMPADNRVRPDLSIPGRPTQTRLLDPDTNIGTGVHLLAALIQRNGGDLRRALAEYNCGVGGVARDQCGPNGGWYYAERVLALYQAAQAVRGNP